jgi:hypothetical protein
LGSIGAASWTLDGQTNRARRRIIARRPGPMVHVDVKKIGRIPDGGGWPGARQGQHPGQNRGRGHHGRRPAG